MAKGSPEYRIPVGLPRSDAGKQRLISFLFLKRNAFPGSESFDNIPRPATDSGTSYTVGCVKKKKPQAFLVSKKEASLEREAEKKEGVRGAGVTFPIPAASPKRPLPLAEI